MIVEDWMYDWHFDMWFTLFYEKYGENCGECGCDRFHWKVKKYSSMYCNNCKKSYSATAETIFENSKLLLPIWGLAFYHHIIKKDNHSRLMERTKLGLVTTTSIRRKLNTINEKSIEFRLLSNFCKEIGEDGLINFYNTEKP